MKGKKKSFAEWLEELTKKFSSYSSFIKEAITLGTALIGLVVLLAKDELSEAFAGRTNFFDVFVIIISVIIAMSIAYVISWLYHSPESAAEKINNPGNRKKTFYILASIVAGLVVLYELFKLSEKNEYQNIDALQYGLVFGVLSGIFVGVFAYIVLKFLWDKIIKRWLRKAEAWGKWDLIIINLIVSLVVAAGLFIFTDISNSMKNYTQETFHSINQTYHDGIATLIAVRDGNIPESGFAIARYFILTFINFLVIYLIYVLLAAVYDNRRKTLSDGRSSPAKTAKPVRKPGRKPNSPKKQ